MFKRGQVTIFIIIAILVVAVVALVLTLSPSLKKGVGGKPDSPENFIQTCLEDTIKENAELIASQGGSLNPEFYYLYQDNKLQYLCYTNELYETCYVQVPFISKHIENEIKESIEADVNFCFNSLKEKYKDSTLTKGDITVELLPKRIVTTIDNTFVFTEAGDTERRESFRIILNNNLYELSRIASSIINWETTYGDSDPDAYMAIYPDLKVEKHLQDDGTAVYIITDRNTKNKFQFASRSLLTSPAQL